ncbi:hypothetical protein J6590_019869 [Homalodisca vitripennis]|nr:hypothetical protein J6590_019869 [Homalodisca vitripennis]
MENHKIEVSHSLTVISFPIVSIESDSHGRHITWLLQQLLTSDTRVRGVCRPGAGLLAVTANDPPPLGSCAIIIAGTNDVADHKQHIIFDHLEHLIAARLATSQVIVATLPHRHDLPPQDPVHKWTDLVNSYIKELCERLQGVHLLDFNRIDRKFFTNHGMHLRLDGKRELARLVIESLRAAENGNAAKIQYERGTLELPAPPVTHYLSLLVEPTTLPQKTYADAVKSKIN